jgi:hypothetical protein
MGDSFYHIFTTPYLFLLTLFFGRHGVGIHNVISKNYHMSVITWISRKICDKMYNPMTCRLEGKKNLRLLIGVKCRFIDTKLI